MQSIERELISDNWITVLFVFAVLLIFLLKLFSQLKLKYHSFSLFNKGFLEIESNEKETFFSLFHILFTIFSFIIISLTLFFFLENQKGSTSHSLLDYLFLSGIIAGYMVLRFSLEYFLVKLFEIRRTVSFFMVSKRSYLYSISIALGVLILIYHYGFREDWLLVGGVMLLFTLRGTLLLINNKKLIINKLFYFILYLCAFEIAPIVIVLKLAILE